MSYKLLIELNSPQRLSQDDRGAFGHQFSTLDPNRETGNKSSSDEMDVVSWFNSHCCLRKPTHRRKCFVSKPWMGLHVENVRCTSGKYLSLSYGVKLLFKVDKAESCCGRYRLCLLGSWCSFCVGDPVGNR